MKAFALAALAATFVWTGAQAAPPPKPKLIVVISVDQFSADLYAEYRGQFSGGMKRLGEGAVFPSGYQSHAATETCPGHSTILTGARPARTGIIANNWFDLSLPREDKKVYCSEDPAAPGSSSSKYVASPNYLKVPTLGDRMKAADPRSRVVSVAGKDRAAIMMGGHAIDQVWYWSGDRFVTLPDRTGPAPAAVAPINARAAAVIAQPGAPVLPANCRSRSVPLQLTDEITVGELVQHKAGETRGFRTDPAYDGLTADLGTALLKDMKLGQGPATDLLIFGLSATDAVGHAYGTEGAEMCAQMMTLDAAVGRVLAALDANGVPYVVALTADHGGFDAPERNAIRGLPGAQRVDPALNLDAISQALAQDFGLTGPVLYGDGIVGDIYLARSIPAALRPRVLSAARARLLAFPQVEGVFTAEELRRMPSPQPPVEEWSLGQRFRAGFDPDRSGDLLVALKPRVATPSKPVAGTVANHGSPWNYDRRVPMLFWWPNASGFEQPLSVETVDIAPTLAALIGLAIPAAEIDGRCLDLDGGSASTCGK